MLTVINFIMFLQKKKNKIFVNKKWMECLKCLLWQMNYILVAETNEKMWKYLLYSTCCSFIETAV